MPLKTVSREQFFQAIGKRNVHPCPRGNYDAVKGYRTEWTLLDTGRIIGESIGGTSFMQTQYSLDATLIHTKGD